MKNVFKYLLLFGAFGVSENIYSQNERFVEVVAVDTVLLKPTGFLYEVTRNTISEEIDELGDLMDSQDPSKYEVGKTLFEIATLLKKEKFDFKIGKSKKIPLSYMRSDSSIVVKLIGVSELERLKTIVEDESDMNGSVMEMIFESAAKYQEETYSTLYARALGQAKLIADITDNEIGKVISVSENTSNGTNWADLYKEIVEKAAFGLYGENDEMEKNEIVKMVFRFELK